MVCNRRRPHTAPQTETVSVRRVCDPVETVMETAARLRLMERLLQYMLAAEASDSERSALLTRYNRHRQELFDRLDSAPPAELVLPEQKKLAEMVAGPLQHHHDQTILKTAASDISQLINQLLLF